MSLRDVRVGEVYAAYTSRPRGSALARDPEGAVMVEVVEIGVANPGDKQRKVRLVIREESAHDGAAMGFRSRRDSVWVHPCWLMSTWQDLLERAEARRIDRELRQVRERRSRARVLDLLDGVPVELSSFSELTRGKWRVRIEGEVQSVLSAHEILGPESDGQLWWSARSLTLEILEQLTQDASQELPVFKAGAWLEKLLSIHDPRELTMALANAQMRVKDEERACCDARSEVLEKLGVRVASNWRRLDQPVDVRGADITGLRRLRDVTPEHAATLEMWVDEAELHRTAIDPDDDLTGALTDILTA